MFFWVNTNYGAGIPLTTANNDNASSQTNNLDAEVGVEQNMDGHY